ncbi:hypothetical protein FPHOBKDP_00036 [Listeria phage LPJP1]|nr:hypothetical protein FPHOBKDP_00036 [Listeria phage LPJP1]
MSRTDTEPISNEDIRKIIISKKNEKIDIIKLVIDIDKKYDTGEENYYPSFIESQFNSYKYDHNIPEICNRILDISRNNPNILDNIDFSIGYNYKLLLYDINLFIKYADSIDINTKIWENITAELIFSQYDIEYDVTIDNIISLDKYAPKLFWNYIIVSNHKLELSVILKYIEYFDLHTIIMTISRYQLPIVSIEYILSTVPLDNANLWFKISRSQENLPKKFIIRYYNKLTKYDNEFKEHPYLIKYMNEDQKFKDALTIMNI